MSSRPTNAPPNCVERCACPLCGADEVQESAYRSGHFAVVRCVSCGAWYLSPRLSEAEIREHYERNDYFEGEETGYDSYLQQECSLRATFRKLLRHLTERGLTGGALLDVGCGYGYFLDEAKPYFVLRAGTEMSRTAAEKARAFADEIYDGGLEAIPLGKKFDTVVGLQLIEHVYHPHDFMARLLGHVKPGGTVLLTTPHMGSLWRKVMGRRWPSFKFPEHVVFYDEDALTSLIRKAGLEDIARIPHPHAFPVHEIGKKLGLPVVPGIASWNMWLPSVVLAVLGRKVRGNRP